MCLLDVLKNDFVEVDEAIFNSVDRQWVLILCILGIKKSALDEVALVTF
jgi:hypothetical protein